VKPPEIDNEWQTIAEFGVLCTVAALLLLAAVWLCPDSVLLP
jgi:hypothetical protein